MKTKVCGRCGEEKALSEFSKDKRAKDGLQYRCKECSNAANAPRYKALRERTKQDRKRREVEEAARESKVCPNCSEDLPLVSFSKNKSNRDGLQGWCKGCTTEKREADKEKISLWKKDYYVRNKEEIGKRLEETREERLAKKRARYWENPERYRSEAREYAAENKEAIRARASAYREANKEAVLARERAWRKNNIDKVRENENRWRSACAGVRVEEVKRAVLKFRDPLCYLCGEEFQEGDSLHVDHKTPLSRAELNPCHSYSNCALTHARCNMKKHSKTPTEYWAWCGIPEDLAEFVHLAL